MVIKHNKVLLVNPPYSSIYNNASSAKGCSNPMNLAYLASYIRDKGIDVEIFDANALQIPFKKLYKKMPRDFGFIGVSSYTPSLHLSIKVLEIAREINPSCRTIIGGSHFTGDPISTMKNNTIIDFGIKNEGEITLFELLNAISGNKKLNDIPGLVYRNKNGKIINNVDRPFVKDIDDFPMPAYDLLPMDRYYLPSHHISVKNIPTRPFSLLFTSRGCYSNCTFCASKVVWKQKVRYHSSERVLSEINYVRNKFNIKTFEFADDNFLLNKNRLNIILDGLVSKENGINFNCLSRVDNIKEDDVERLKKAGCYLIRFGVESGSQEILDRMRKKITKDQIKSAFKAAKKVGVAANASIIIGSPGETKDTIKETLALLLEIDPNIINFFYSMPLVGTDVRDEVLQKQQLMNDEWHNWDIMATPMAVTDKMELDEIIEAQKMFYRQYYFRPTYILKKLIQIRSLAILMKYFKGFMTALRLALKPTIQK